MWRNDIPSSFIWLVLPKIMKSNFSSEGVNDKDLQIGWRTKLENRKFRWWKLKKRWITNFFRLRSSSITNNRKWCHWITSCVPSNITMRIFSWISQELYHIYFSYFTKPGRNKQGKGVEWHKSPRRRRIHNLSKKFFHLEIFVF